MSLPHAVLEISANVGLFSDVLLRLTTEWSPDEIPLTVAMSELGNAFASAAPTLSENDARTVLGRVEALLREGSEQVKDAVATGFLEAMVAVLDEAPESRWILRFLGPRSSNYLAEWAAFCGTEAPS